ncbi:proline-rich receptor-like protein kinase PERK4 [Euphorbia lathyris]|uniref:proline-rich receptor-like protein kinase PERK4 n=1 Tax=Euphorbia lathyris TaxID=212925 RepID=UPI0033142232
MSSPPGNSTAPSPDSDSPPSPAAPPPPKSGSNSTSPPPPKSSKSPPPPPSNKSSPAPKNSPSPPTSNDSPPAPPPPKSSSNNRSPPPPPKSPSSSSSRSPSTSSSSSSSSSSDDNSGISDDQVKLIIGVCVGVGLFIILMIIICIATCCKKKKRRRPMQYYGDYREGSQYYPNQPQKWQQNNQQMGADHIMRINQSGAGGGGMGMGMNSSPGGGGGGGGGWYNNGAPQQQTSGSGEMSSDLSGGPQRPPLPPPSPGISLGFNKSTFTYEELAAATGGFADRNLLGQGGFGYVHKGVFGNGKEVAVKSLKSGSGQGEREFQAEVEIISRVHHRHLVSLVGYCIAGGQRMLVYDFVPNNNLEYHLHVKSNPVMDFSTRLRIALGSAKGLAYLHEDCHPKIIHRDIKSANILIDLNFEAMVADFGLAKLSSDNHTHVSTRVMGTFGYLAPEYASSGKLSDKSDVFSFGVMLLEIITGKKPVDPSNMMEDSLVDWARPLLNQSLDDNSSCGGLIDIRLDNNYNREEMKRMLACAAASIRHSARKRPKMSQIVRALEGDVSLDDLNEGTKPGHSSIFTSSSDSTNYNASSYNADMKKFRQVALSSQEFGSSEIGSSSNDSQELSPRDVRNNHL